MLLQTLFGALIQVILIIFEEDLLIAVSNDKFSRGGTGDRIGSVVGCGPGGSIFNSLVVVNVMSPWRGWILRIVGCGGSLWWGSPG